MSLTVRRLRPAERSVPATRATTMLPAVVEPPCASASLRDALASQAQQVLAALDAHGAVSSIATTRAATYPHLLHRHHRPHRHRHRRTSRVNPCRHQPHRHQPHRHPGPRRA